MATKNITDSRLAKAREAFLGYFAPVENILKSRYDIDIHEVAEKALYADQLWGLISGHWSKSLFYIVPRTDNDFSGVPEWNVVRLVTTRKRDGDKIVAGSVWVEKGPRQVDVPFEKITDVNGIEKVKYLPDKIAPKFSSSLPKNENILCERGNNPIEALDPETKQETEAHQRYRLTGTFGDLIYRVPRMDKEGKISYDKNTGRPDCEWVIGAESKSRNPFWKDFKEAADSFVIINCSGKDNERLQAVRQGINDLALVKGALNELEAGNKDAMERGYKKYFRYDELLRRREEYEAGVKDIIKMCGCESPENLKKILDLPGVNIEYAFSDKKAFVGSPSKFDPSVCLMLPYPLVLADLKKRYEMKTENGIEYRPIILSFKQNGQDTTLRFPVNEEVLRNLAAGGLVKVESEIPAAEGSPEKGKTRSETVKLNVGTMEVIRGISLFAAKKMERERILESKNAATEAAKAAKQLGRKTTEKSSAQEVGNSGPKL